MPTGTWLLIGGGIASLVGLSILVGFASEGWEGFNWEVAAMFGTAIGTSALAGFTGALASQTRSDVRATWTLKRRPLASSG